MSGIPPKFKETNKIIRRKGHFQCAPAESNIDLTSTINTTVESFNAFGINDESMQIASSGDDVPLRSPFVKNTIPANLLVRQLAQVVEHQPQLNAEEKVRIWRWEAVVSPVEDVLDFEERFQQREAAVANKSKRKNKTKKSQTLNENFDEAYNFVEFMQRLEKNLQQSIKQRNSKAVKNVPETKRKRAMNRTEFTEEQPKNKISKKSTNVETNVKEPKATKEINAQLKKPAKKIQKQAVVKVKPLTKRQEELKQEKEQNKLVEKQENSLIVFREDFTKTKTCAPLFKLVANTSTAQNELPTSTTTATNEPIIDTNDKQNDGVFHQQHVFCNYLGLTGMSTATALANAAAELSNCATRRYSIRVRQLQQKEKQIQEQAKAKQAAAATNEKTNRRLTICGTFTKPEPSKVVSLDIKKAKEASKAKLAKLLPMRSEFRYSVSERKRSDVPVRIVHSFSSISEERPKPKEPNIFMPPKLQTLNGTTPAKRIFSEEFTRNFQARFVPVAGKIQIMNMKNVNNTTKKMLLPTTTANNLLREQTISLISAPGRNLLTNLNALRNEKAKKVEIASVEILKPMPTIAETAAKKSQMNEISTAVQELENPKVEIIDVQILNSQPAVVKDPQSLENSTVKKESPNSKDIEENKVEITTVAESDVKSKEENEIKQEFINTEENKFEITFLETLNLADKNEFSTSPEESKVEHISKENSIIEEQTEEKTMQEKSLLEINSNLNLQPNIESEPLEEKNNAEITMETIEALTANDIIFADDFIMTVKNENGAEKVISDNVNDLIEEVDETDDLNEQFNASNNNLTNVQECFDHNTVIKMDTEILQNNHTIVDEPIINNENVHSIQQIHKNIEIIDVSELPLILSNSQAHEYDTENLIKNNLQDDQINSQLINANGSLNMNINKVAEPAMFVNNVDITASDEQNAATSMQNLYKNVQYFHKISTTHTKNPLTYKYGKVLHIYYELDVLLVVQELMISFWKSSKLMNALKISTLEELECNKNEWLLLDICPRCLKDIEISAPYSSRISIHNAITHYCELRGYHLPTEEDFFSLYVNVYFYNEEEMQGKKRTIKLDSVKSIPQEITYITLFESHYIVFCWSQIVQEKRQKTGMCKYSLAPNFERIACIRDFKELNQHIKHLEVINDKLYGYGETTLTVWNHRSGDVYMNFDFEIQLGRNIGSIHYQSPEIEQNNMMLLFQHVLTPAAEHQLLLIMCSVSAQTPSYRILKRLPLPMSAFHEGILSSENNGEHIIIRAKKTYVELWISCGDPNTMFLMPPQQSERFYVRGRPQVINVTENSVTVDTIINHLLKSQAVDSTLNSHNLST